jgi:hypothetical protein
VHFIDGGSQLGPTGSFVARLLAEALGRKRDAAGFRKFH